MSKKFEETTAIIELSTETQVDAAVLGAHLQRELNLAGFGLDRLQMLSDAGCRLGGAELEMVLYLDQGSPNSFLVTVYGNSSVAEPKKLRRDRFRLCSMTVETLLAGVTADRVAMYHNGVSYVTNRGEEIVVRRDRSARLRQRPEAARKRGLPGADGPAPAAQTPAARRRGFTVTTNPAAFML